MADASEDHPGRGRATRLVARLALAGVSVIAAVASYFHALAVVQAAGARPPVAWLVPVLADLVILGASAALLDASRQNLSRPRLAMLSLVAGIGVTVAMNVAAGWSHGAAGALVAGWPALAFILALESLIGLVRRGRGGTVPSPAPAAHGQCGHLAPMTVDEAIRMADEHARQCLSRPVSQRQLAASFGQPRSKVAALVAPDASAGTQTRPGRPPGTSRPGRPDVPAPASRQDSPAGAGALNGNHP